jgi:hypothetical protein
MVGTLNDMTEHDFVLVDQAYNEAFVSTERSIQDVQSQAEIVIVTALTDPACNLCPPDDDAAMQVENTSMVIAVVVRSKEDGTAEDVNEGMMENMHTAFEKVFCYKMQNSGVANFANVHDCSFRFVSHPVESGMVQQA